MKIEEINKIIAEGRDAYLYHLTDFESFTDILRSGKIQQSIHVDGVSLTRNRRLRSVEGTGRKEIKLVLDQRRLAQNHKIQPFNDQGIPKTKPENSREDEELVVGDINNISRYLVGAVVIGTFDDVMRDMGVRSAWDMFEELEQLSKTYRIPIQDENGWTVDQWMDENYDDLAAEVA